MKLTAPLTVLLVLSVLGHPALSGEQPEVPDMAAAVEAFDGGDYDRAVALWRSLAAGGDVRAMVALGGLHQSGEGIGQNLTKARDWYRRAAIGGSAEGMQSFGHMLLQGHGGVMDSRAAYCWFSRAGYKGKAWAREMLGRLARDLPKIPQAGECRALRARTGAASVNQ